MAPSPRTRDATDLAVHYFSTVAPSFRAASLVSSEPALFGENAGNFEHTHSATFAVNQTGYVPVLGKPRVTVRRLSGGVWRPFATYSVSVSRYASSYSLSKRISRAGAYRVRASEGAGASTWSKGFRIR
jgi:hypothetical protein